MESVRLFVRRIVVAVSSFRRSTTMLAKASRLVGNPRGTFGFSWGRTLGSVQLSTARKLLVVWDSWLLTSNEEQASSASPDGNVIQKRTGRPLYLDVLATTPMVPRIYGRILCLIYLGSACAGCDAAVLDSSIWQPAFAHACVWLGVRRCS